MKAICISAIASNQGKTVLTTALLYHFRKSVRPFKIGPDYIDPQFHKSVCAQDSVNLDNYIMNEKQVKWVFNKYSDKEYAILEGVMGFYDGMDKGSSAYDVSKLLNIPTVLILDASGSYITTSAVVKGLRTYKNDNTIKAIVLNNVSSSMHYDLVKNQIKSDFDDVEVVGWIKKGLETLSSTHLGLDLANNQKELLESISKEVLENIDLEAIEMVCEYKKEEVLDYPFEEVQKIDKKISVVNDSNFSFLYYDNLRFLQETFSSVEIVDSTKNEIISEDSDIVYICGGYVETKEAYDKVKDSNNFKESLIKHSINKNIYGECAGLLYLGKSVDDKKMSGLLDLEFTLEKRRQRLGYYYNDFGIKGHAFHFTKPKEDYEGVYCLQKSSKIKGKTASFRKEKVFGTYLHTMFRNNFNQIRSDFGL